MYPSGDSHFGKFVEEQVRTLEDSDTSVLKCVRTSKNILSYFSFYSRSICCLLFKKYDLIHAHYGFHSAFPAVLFGCRPMIVTYHGSDALIEPYRNFIYHKLQEMTLNNAAHIIAVSKAIKEHLISNSGVPDSKISVISCGVDSSLFHKIPGKNNLRKELGLPENKKIILFVGEVSYNKGADIIYECAKNLKEHLFVLVGEIKYRESAPSNCILTGPKPYAELYKWMNACDIFFLPSRSEGTPVSLLEAMACELPPVVSKVGGMPDVVEENKTGWLVDIQNIPGTVNKLNEITDNYEALKNTGINARGDVIKRFDKSVIAGRIKEVYNRIIN